MTITTFHYVGLSAKPKDIEHLFLGSFVLGEIIYWCFALIPISLGYIPDIIGITLSSIILAYFVGRFRTSNYFLRLCDILKIQASPNEYIWNDIIDPTYPTKLIVHLDNIVVEGYPINIEENSRSPIVELAGYVVKSTDNQTINDCRENGTKAICIDLEKAKYIEVKYYEQSELHNRIKRACKNNLQTTSSSTNVESETNQPPLN